MHPNLASAKASFLKRAGSEFTVSGGSDLIGNKRAFSEDLIIARSEVANSISRINDTYVAQGGKGTNGALVYIEDMRLKASASTERNFDFIAVNIGLAATLWRFAYYVSRHYTSIRDGFCPLGNEVGADRNVLTPQEDISIEFRDLEELEGDDRRIHQILFVEAMRWIGHHELAHIWNGHLGYKNSNLFKKNKLDKNHIEMAFEIDADSRAVSGILCDLQSPNRLNTFLRFDGKARDTVIYINTQLSVMGHLIALMFDIIKNIGNKAVFVNHPEPLSRFAAIYQSIDERLPQMFICDDLGCAGAEAAKIIIDAIKYYFPGTWQIIERDPDSPSVLMTREQLHYTWNEICQDVVDFSRGFMLPGKYINGVQVSSVFRKT